MKVRNLFFLIFALSVVFTACDASRVFEAYKSIPNSDWDKDSVVVFEVNIEDTLSFHNIYIDLRNNSAYPYSNLFLFVKTTSPAQIVLCDTVEYMLTDARGRWLGKGFSKLIDNRLIYRSTVRFPVKGIYRFEIQQGMRTYVLSEIANVGLRIEKTITN